MPGRLIFVESLTFKGNDSLSQPRTESAAQLINVNKRQMCFIQYVNL